ncbi:hypothetical protein D3C77_788060 [compost metagenome]
MSAWSELFREPEARMDAAEQYDELVRLADKFQRQGLLTLEERSALILEATDHYAAAVQKLRLSA